jgi:hypothetical protein
VEQPAYLRRFRTFQKAAHLVIVSTSCEPRAANECLESNPKQRKGGRVKMMLYQNNYCVVMLLRYAKARQRRSYPIIGWHFAFVNRKAK